MTRIVVVRFTITQPRKNGHRLLDSSAIRAAEARRDECHFGFDFASDAYAELSRAFVHRSSFRPRNLEHPEWDSTHSIGHELGCLIKSAHIRFMDIGGCTSMTAAVVLSRIAGEIAWPRLEMFSSPTFTL
jgi:hypothetical protein